MFRTSFYRISFIFIFFIMLLPSAALAALLVVDFKTNFVPNVDFSYAKTTLDGGMEHIQSMGSNVYRCSDGATCVRAAEYDLSENRTIRVRVVLLKADRSPVTGASRDMIVDFRNSNIVTTLLIPKPEVEDPPPAQAVTTINVDLVPYVNTSIPRIGPDAPLPPPPSIDTSGAAPAPAAAEPIPIDDKSIAGNLPNEGESGQASASNDQAASNSGTSNAAGSCSLTLTGSEGSIVTFLFWITLLVPGFLRWFFKRHEAPN